jgi:hypothetical protein
MARADWSTREEVYRMNTLTFMEGLLQDARHAVRIIRTKPGFSAAVLTGSDLWREMLG